MIRRDMEEVLAIENTLTEVPPWEEEDFLRLLRQRNCIGMAVEDTSLEIPDPLGPAHPVVGFMIYGLHKFKLDLLRLAVHPSWRRQGVARKMMEVLSSKLSSHRRSVISCILQESNLQMQMFFKHLGWTCSKIHKDHFGPGEHGYYFFKRFFPVSEEELDYLESQRKENA
jgi:ribosomal-protein-alanine N-acetyltransferase